MKVYIVGAGPWDTDLLTKKAVDTIEKSDVILTTNHFKNNSILRDKEVKFLSINEIIEYIKNAKDIENLCVLASGDIGFYSIANTVKNSLSDKFNLEFISGISSFQYLSAKIFVPYDKIKLVSLHGKNANIVAHASYNEYVFCLTGGENSAKNIIKKLFEAGLKNVKITVGENLSFENERIVTYEISEVLETDFSGLCALIIHNENFARHYTNISDDEFIRGKVPMTKQIIRDSSVSLLNISPTDIVYDIGAGTGSVSVAMAKKAYEGSVFAVEKKSEAVSLIKENIEKFGTYNIEILEETAPNGLENLPAPSKVFIGGSTGNLREIVDVIFKKNIKAQIIVTAVSLQTLTETIQIFEELEIPSEIFNVMVSKSKKLGRYDLMIGENPVYIIKASEREKYEENTTNHHRGNI